MNWAAKLLMAKTDKVLLLLFKCWATQDSWISYILCSSCILVSEIFIDESKFLIQHELNITTFLNAFRLDFKIIVKTQIEVWKL